MPQKLLYKNMVIALKKEMPEEDTAALRRAAENKELLICLCNDLGLTVQAKRLGKTYYTSRTIGTGALHDPSCDDYAVSGAVEQTRLRLLTLGAFNEFRNGEISVNIGIAMARSESVEQLQLARQPLPKVRHDTSRSTTTLTGTLCYALERAGLCRYNPLAPPKANWSAAAWQVERIFSRMCFGKTPVGSRLIFPRVHNKDRVAAVLASLRKRPGDSREIFGLLVGIVKRVAAAESDAFVRVWIEYWMEPFLVPRDHWDAAIRNSISANAGAAVEDLESAHGDSRLLLIARCQVDASGKCVLSHVGTQVTSRHWIPVVSGYELQVANALADQGHHFSRPMRASANCPYVPDFIRHSARGDIPMEVAGMMDKPEYVADLEDKLAEYPNYFALPCWVWYASPRTNPPSFEQDVSPVTDGHGAPSQDRPASVRDRSRLAQRHRP